jgi:hypothetical protein
MVTGLGLMLLMLTAPACVRRTIAITSTPSQALVYVNEREVGRTPCEVDFLFYGEYDVRLKLDGYESIVGSGTASAPFWDFIGADLVSEIAPLNLESRVEWHFTFSPADNSFPDLMERARAMRTAVHEDKTLADAETSVRRGAAGASKPAKAAKSAADLKPAEMGSGDPQGALPGQGSADVPVPPTEVMPPKR